MDSQQPETSKPHVHVGFVSGTPRGPESGFLWGAVICIVGITFLLDRMGWIEAGRIFRFWPMILVLAGILNMRTPAGRGWGLILLIAGVLLQLNGLGLAHVRIWDLWPLIIIAVGLTLIWSSIEARRRGAQNPGSTRPSLDSDSTVNLVAVFGGCERRVGSQAFRGGKAMAVFGGIELDLRDATIEGDEAVLDLNCVFGGVEIHVPRNWNIDARCVPVFGGYSDETRQAIAADPTIEREKRLVITGTVLFGGVEISN